MNFFRYPGGKSRLVSQILPYLSKNITSSSYREPFFGGGSIGLSLFSKENKIKNIWLNDFDKALSDLWYSVYEHPEELKKLIKEFVPSLESFYSIKSFLLKDDEQNPIINGFNKLAIHQLSYSGLGMKSGGPLGGKLQESKYKIGCRWNSNTLCLGIDRIHNILRKYNTKITSLDFSKLIQDESEKSLIYLDPPYYEKGKELYQYSFSEEKHKDLMLLLSKTNHNWVLSYDDNPIIRKLYSWAKIIEIDTTYTINTSSKKKNTKKELLILSKDN
jgi:DNA adenine methylase